MSGQALQNAGMLHLLELVFTPVQQDWYPNTLFTPVQARLVSLFKHTFFPGVGNLDSSELAAATHLASQLKLDPRETGWSLELYKVILCIYKKFYLFVYVQIIGRLCLFTSDNRFYDTIFFCCLSCGILQLFKANSPSWGYIGVLPWETKVNVWKNNCRR